MGDSKKTANGPADSDAAADTPTPRRRYRRRLSNLRNVRTGLADVIRELETGARDVKEARTLAYAYSVLAGIIETSRKQEDLAERIAKLEDAVAQAHR